MHSLSRFATIDLPSLQQQASLQTRRDRKYLVPQQQVQRILADLPESTQVLTISQTQSFLYHSTYFDTPALNSFHAAAHNRRRRFKVRTRSYPSGQVWLEVKTRGMRGITIKDRFPHRGPAHRLSADSLTQISATLDTAGISLNINLLAPALHTRYRRTTVLLPDGVRATIDTDLNWCRPEGLLHTAGSVSVIETKSDPRSAGSLVDAAMRSEGYRPVRLSKYGVGMVLSTPALRGNRWHRVLTHIRDAGVLTLPMAS